MDRETIRSYDALIGVLWAVGMAVGVVFVYKTPGYAPNLMTYLFGNILLVTRRDLLAILVLAVSVLAILAVFFKGIVAVAFDEVFARVRGLPVRLLMALLLGMIALSVVILIQVVGIILVVALLTIPSVISLMLWKDLRSVLARLGRDRRRHHPRRSRPLLRTTTSPRARRSSCSGRCC